MTQVMKDSVTSFGVPLIAKPSPLYYSIANNINGRVSTKNTTIVPAFYYTQVELTGPFKAYTLHNQCKTIKVWICVFCCTTTTTSIIRIMENYSFDLRANSNMQRNFFLTKEACFLVDVL